jgi:hypothetical protein
MLHKLLVYVPPVFWCLERMHVDYLIVGLALRWVSVAQEGVPAAEVDQRNIVSHQVREHASCLHVLCSMRKLSTRVYTVLEQGNQLL